MAALRYGHCISNHLPDNMQITKMLLNSSGFINLWLRLLSFPWTTTLDMPRPVMDLSIAVSRYIMAFARVKPSTCTPVYSPPRCLPAADKKMQNKEKVILDLLRLL